MTEERVGPYAIVEELARRPFVLTVRAVHEVLGRRVVVRMLKPTIAVSSPFAADLEREAGVLARLDHPSIVRLLEWVDTPTAVYLVLDDASGVPLSAVLEKARPSVDQAVAVALLVARGLAHAHERGVVHRDLRPEHVELLPRGGARIASFERAAIGAPATGIEALEPESDLSNMDFMAPEQILGEPATARCDVFSAGALLYRMLAGRPPFAPDEPARSAGEGGTAPAPPRAIERIRSANPPSIPGVPQHVERLLGLALARDPDDRFPTADALVEALAAALAELTETPPERLAAALLAEGGYSVDVPAAQPRARSEPARPHMMASGPSVGAAARALGFVSLLVIAGAVGIELARDPESPAALGRAHVTDLARGTQERGFLKPVAVPWADVYVDGELVDTTPVGRPIPVRAGRHWVTFRHPTAPDEQRSIVVEAGQTVLVDVTMQPVRVHIDAGVDAGPATP